MTGSDESKATNDDVLLRPDVASCRRLAPRAFAVMAEIMDDRDSGAANRLRAAVEIVERAWGKPVTEDGDMHEPNLADYLSRLGPREPGPPAVLEERSQALCSISNLRR